jgi:hypothetical protein
MASEDVFPLSQFLVFVPHNGTGSLNTLKKQKVLALPMQYKDSFMGHEVP